MADACWQFTPKHVWSTKNNAISGICLGAWLELLIRRRAHVQWSRYWLRVLFITLLATFNSLLALVETLVNGRAIAQQAVHPRPLFVLGHPRTGTTLLHTLLALDTENFGFCSTFCAAFPYSFLWFERFKGLFSGLIDERRPMDNVALSLDTPQEDELAMNVMTAGTSPYMPLSFMTDEPSFRRYFSFKTAAPHERRRWVEAFQLMTRKLSLRAGARRLLLKSPAHTARVALLLQLFPDAQFIYIHRHPLTVYKSACHMADTTYWYMYLATPSNAQIHEFILSQFETLWAEYAADRALVPPGNLAEVGYDELTADPAGTLARIYADLQIESSEGFEQRVRPRIAALLGGQLRGYQKNQHCDLPPELQAVVARRWADYTKEWGYEIS